MISLYRRLRMNTAILYIQSGGKRLPAKKSLKNNLHLQRHTLWSLNSRSTRLWSRLVSRSTAVEIVVALDEGHLPGKIWLVTSVAKRAISRKTTGQTEMYMVGIYPRSPQLSFHNRLLRSLLSQIPKIWQRPPWPSTTTSKSGATLAIMVRLYGYFSERMSIRSGEISKERSHMFVFPILTPKQ